MSTDFKLSAQLPLVKKVSGKGFIIVAVAVLFTSCVSKRLFVEEQYKNARYSENLQDCESKYSLLANDYDKLMNEKLNLEMRLASEQSKAIMTEQQLEYFRNNSAY